MSFIQDHDLGPLASYGVLLEDFTPEKIKNAESPCKAYKEMKEHWELPLALRGGTLKMREGKQKWLPKEPKESVVAYTNRLARSVCYGAFNRTVNTLAGLPFMRPVTTENIPEELGYLKSDCDNTGRDLTSFSNSLLKEMLELGLTHFIVDMPYFEGDVSIEEEEKYKIRPYFTQISPTNLIRWTTARVGGLTILTSISIKEEYYVQKNAFEEEEIEQVRVITPNSIQIWREDEQSEEWYLHDTIPNELGKIPLVTVYGDYDGFMQGKPPLEDLAWLNLKHYQQQSDLDHIQHVANVPILFGQGFDPAEMEGVEVGPDRLIIGPENSSLEYVEHTGSAIGSSRESLKALEEQMAAMGADLIVRKSVDRQTATARQIDQSESVSMLQLMVNNLESAIEQGIQLAAEWAGVEVEDVQVDAGDYLDTPAGPNTIDVLIQYLMESKGITIEDVQTELKRRGVLSDVFKIGKRGETPQNQDKGTGGLSQNNIN